MDQTKHYYIQDLITGRMWMIVLLFILVLFSHLTPFFIIDILAIISDIAVYIDNWIQIVGTVWFSSSMGLLTN